MFHNSHLQKIYVCLHSEKRVLEALPNLVLHGLTLIYPSNDSYPSNDFRNYS